MSKLRMLINKNKTLRAALLFGAFMYAQLVILRACNAAGRGFLSDDRQAWVYCLLQVPVIAGYLLHAVLQPRLSPKFYAALSAGALGLCAMGAFGLLFASPASLFYLIAAGVTVFLLGWGCGAVYLKLSALMGRAFAGFGVTGGYAAAVALQFVTQLQWTLRPAAAALLALSFALLAVFFTEKAPEPQAEADLSAEASPVSRRRLLRTAAVTAAFLLFTAYYTGYIHHLQVASGYGEYNVYTWPRLLLIPVTLLFGWLGSVKDGRLLPVGTLCVVATAFLNTALIGRETYALNMCLYYIALGAVVAYYHLAFLRPASRTKNPALWAGMGRLLDSATVVLSFGVRFSDLPRAAVLAVDIGLLALVIVLMTLNRDFVLDAPSPTADAVSAPVTAPVTAPVPAPVKADPFPLLQARFGITPAEMNVLRELVLTDDKQEAIAARLHISVSTMRHHITSIYKKTDVQSRAGLCRLAAADEFLSAAVK